MSEVSYGPGCLAKSDNNTIQLDQALCCCRCQHSGPSDHVLLMHPLWFIMLGQPSAIQFMSHTMHCIWKRWRTSRNGGSCWIHISLKDVCLAFRGVEIESAKNNCKSQPVQLLAEFVLWDMLCHIHKACTYCCLDGAVARSGKVPLLMLYTQAHGCLHNLLIWLLLLSVAMLRAVYHVAGVFFVVESSCFNTDIMTHSIVKLMPG